MKIPGGTRNIRSDRFSTAGCFDAVGVGPLTVASDLGVGFCVGGQSRGPENPGNGPIPVSAKGGLQGGTAVRPKGGGGWALEVRE